MSVPFFTHPFITSAEISLVRDRNPAPAEGTAKGTLTARAIDAVDGTAIDVDKKVSNGYKPKAWKIEDAPTLSIYKGSTLVGQV
jgi:hypothetical protein